MKAIICKNMKRTDDRVIIEKVINKLQDFGIEADFSDFVREDCDVIITVGGDGTILHHGKDAARKGLPLLGINTGRLGFMTSIELSELDKLNLLNRGDYHICSRMLLEAEVGKDSFLVLNDAVIYRGADSKLPEFNVSINNRTVSEFRADGLILNTPTGSTAYALSAGGPIIEPWLDCIGFTPICAHSLLGRPAVFSSDYPVTVKVGEEPERKVLISVDGEKGVELQKNQNVIIKKSDLRFSLIDLNGGSFHNAIREKLMKPR
ncbi:MAG: NAD(+)/NADH kinase [Oscillospiraceae bacterium]|nr:NAD(+)/NADH kinase [Oscillospiraceae bacterium]